MKMRKLKILKIINEEIKLHRGDAYRDVKDCETCQILDRLYKKFK